MQVLTSIVHYGGVTCILLIVKLAPKADTGLIKCGFNISGHNQNLKFSKPHRRN